MYKLVVYVGDRKTYSISKPFPITFHKDAPTKVHKMILDSLPTSDFKVLSEAELKSGKFQTTKPILFRAALGLENILATFASIRRIRENHPTSPIHILALQKKYNCLYELLGIDNYKLVESIQVEPGQWLKEYSPKAATTSPLFTPANLLAVTREFAYLNHYKLTELPRDTKDSLSPLPRDSGNKHIAVILQGETLGSTYELQLKGSQLEKQYNVVYIDGNSSISNALSILKDSQYVVSLGDNELNALVAYLQIPMFAFLRSIENIHLVQLTKFNKLKENYVTYSPHVNVDQKVIIAKLCQYITQFVTPNIEPEEEVSIEPQQLREPVGLGPDITNEPPIEGRRNRRYPKRND